MTAEKRKPLTRREVLELCLRQNGRCGCGCGQKLDPMGAGVTDEHQISLAAGGTNDLSNRALLCTPCAREKTKADAGIIAKTRRMGGGKGSQVARRAAGKTKPIKSRGFDARFKRKFDGTVERREP